MLIWQQIRYLKYIILFQESLKICISQLIVKIDLKQGSFSQIRHCLTGHIKIWNHFFYQKISKYFDDFQNQNFPVLWLKWTQTIKMSQNQTFFYEIYSNLIEIYSSQNNKIFHWLLEFSSLNFTTDLCTNK